MTRPKHAAPLLLIAVTLVPLGISAAAQDSPARERFRLGEERYLEEEYEEALLHFQASYALRAHPPTLYHVGLCQARLGRSAEAWLTFHRYLDLVDEPAPRRNAEREIAALERRIGFLLVHVSPSSGVALVLDGRLLPPARRAPIDPGSHELRASADGYRTEVRTVLGLAGQTTELDIRLVRIRSLGRLIVHTQPAGAVIRMDGRVVGRTPATLELPAGGHRIFLTRSGHADLSREVVVRRDSVRRLRLRMQPTTTILQRWWFWAGLALIAGAGTTTAILVTSRDPPPHGTIATIPVGLTAVP